MRKSFFFLVSVLLAVPALFGAPDPNRNYRLKSLYWQAYTGDQDTLGLFHLDQAKPVADKEMEGEMQGAEKVVEERAESDPLESHEKQEGGGNVEDSGPQKLPGETVGVVQWLATGRFGGSLALSGGQSVLLTRAYPDVKGGKDGTVECWIRARRPETGHRVVFSLDGSRAKVSAIELRLTAEGRLALAAHGQVFSVSESELMPEEWSHLALQWGRQPASAVRLFLHAACRATVQDPALAVALRDLSGVVRVGNDARGESGLEAVFDEIRISCMARPFYTWDVGWTDPEAKRPVADASPYLRDRSDLLFAASFDGTLSPEVCAERTSVDTPFEANAKGEPRQPPRPDYHEGVRGQALRVGSGLAMPLWAGDGNFNPARGSFEFWFQPWDWDNHKVQGFHDPMEHVPLFRVVRRGVQPQESPAEVVVFGIFRKQPKEAPPHPPLEPGQWTHVVGNYEGGQVRLFLNGKPMPEATAYASAAQPPGAKEPAAGYQILFDPILPRVNYHGEQTLIDELRLYSRPLTPEEVANAFERYRPESVLRPLPFAHTAVSMNHPIQTLQVVLELLSPRREEVATVSIRALGPEGDSPIAEGTIREFSNGRGEFRAASSRVGYGRHRVDLRFLDAAGGLLGEMNLEQDRERPPWLGCTAGVHGEVLPGWDPIRAEGRSVRFWGRELVLAPSGLPEKLISQGSDLLAGPVRVLAAAAGEPLAWQPEAAGPKIVTATDLAAVTSGRLAGGGWTLDTRMTTEYDGLMKVEMTLGGEPPAELDSFRIEFPLQARHAILLGYWTGERNFRAGTWHDLLPPGDGVLFESHKPRCARHPEIRGSFIPHLFLGDDERGLAWFAENDRGWTKAADRPAIEVERQQAVVTLRLHMITEKTRLAEPRTFVFGLHPTPVKALPPGWRGEGSKLNFGFCDSFSTQQLKTDGDYGNFNIYPQDDDWTAAARRVEKHREHYGSFYGYRGPFLYIDRNWVGLPPSAGEFSGIWYRSGFFRYLPEARDCHLWNIDQWLRRQLIVGVYIDDVWIGTCKDPETGPAYRLEDGYVQPGFEFFDYHEYMKRLRWIFIDNGMPPTIWCHMTHTLFIPCLSFAEYLLDGEDRFPNWGASWDFLDAWPPGRIRYNNGQKWGLVPTWFIKIGGDAQPTTPMPHWQYRQSRAYTASTVLNDIIAAGVPAEILKEIYEPADARCVGYWSADNPAAFDRPDLCASFWLRAGKTVGLVVNRSKADVEASVALDPAKLGFPGVPPDSIAVEDIDRADPPKGEDITTMKTPTAPSAAEEEEKDEFMDEIGEEEKQERIRASGIIPLDDHNFRWKSGKLVLRVRGHDYRLLMFTGPRRGTDGP
ncbi:MAG: hypothetical protein HYU36_16985 [Planctomycetes bacterium]|nr:hypothetical protein [Planctomycetota bacterium]